MSVCPAGFDLTDPDVNLVAVPHEEFALRRRTAPVAWVEQTPEARAGMAGGTGYWAVTKHEDVLAVSKNGAVFSSWENGAIIRLPETTTRESVEMTRVVIINQDAPEHTQTRRIISRGFTPRAVSALEDGMRERARRVVAEAVAQGGGDFVQQIAAQLPLETIADLLGIPAEDRQKLFDWTNQMTASEDPDYAGDPQAASTEVLMYAVGLANERAECPRDDIVTKLVTADIDGNELTSDEFGFFTLVLAVAGNETTRNAITHGIMAFAAHPDQWELYKAERPETTADEIVRWATPVVSFQRTATRDTVLGGQQIKKGDRVGMYYASANFDEDVFDDPYTFNIKRDPNPHLGFGGTGAHYCIGANLARMEINLMFNAIADHMPDLKLTGEPDRLKSAWLNGIKALPADYGKCPVAH